MVANSVIEALLQLSFFFENTSKLRQRYMTNDFDIVGLLHKVTRSDLLFGRGVELTDATLRSAKRLLQRLQERDEAQQERLIGPRRHIMLSYSWAAHKGLVALLAQELRRLGYDVWRDEEGSSILPKLEGDTDQRMAEAVVSE